MSQTPIVYYSVPQGGMHVVGAAVPVRPHTLIIVISDDRLPEAYQRPGNDGLIHFRPSARPYRVITYTNYGKPVCLVEHYLQEKGNHNLIYVERFFE